ncbi:hypothetical protein HNY73_008515 [Argiope bruennichi]|uniref:Uncharacterized protein n=1 Tax=Argiope bruennichi TaxID=94029 RepID=A0A8T0F6Q6_ARGBR|nr:hypothetical protein HNY73_008515 [Argiope bruennichi]
MIKCVGEPTDFDHVVPELNLPSSHLYLREFGGESLVLAKERLEAGTVLGTYKGHLQQPVTEDSNGLLKVSGQLLEESTKVYSVSHKSLE